MCRATLLGLLTVGCGVEANVTGCLGGRVVTVRGLVQGIQREDGSGRCFNVAMLVQGQACVVFVRTVG